MRRCTECQWHYQQTDKYLTCRKNAKVMPIDVHACPALVLMDAPYGCDVKKATKVAKLKGGAV